MTIRQKTTVTLKYSGEGKSHSRTDIQVRDLVAIVDEPVERGGTNEGPSPTEMAYAALIGCTNVIGQKCADKHGIDVGHLSFAMEVDFDRRGVLLMEEVDVPFKAVRIAVTADGPATEDELAQVARETEKYCAISKLYQNSGTDLTVNWAKA